MLDARIIIKSIDYKETLKETFPAVKKYITEKRSESNVKAKAIRLFKKLDDDSLKIAIKILSFFPNEKAITELVVQILNSKSSCIIDMVNALLAWNHIGKHLHVGKFSIDKRDDFIDLRIFQIYIDYKNLAEERIHPWWKLVINIAKKCDQIVPQFVLGAINVPMIEKKLVMFIQEKLNERGIVIKLGGIELKRHTEIASDTTEVDNHLQLTGAMEELILDVLANFLKDNITA